MLKRILVILFLKTYIYIYIIIYLYNIYINAYHNNLDIIILLFLIVKYLI